MVGRDAELTRDRLVARRPPGRARPTSWSTCCWPATPGVGKTRLLRALRDLAVDEGWQVYAGHCLDFGDSALPYLPFSEVARPPGHRAARGRRRGRRRPPRARPAAARAPPDGRHRRRRRRDLRPRPRRPVPRDARRARGRRPHARRCCWSSRTPTGPTSRPATCSASCSRASTPAGFAVVASYRSDDLHRRHPLRRQVAEWSRLRGVDRINLSPLDDDAVRSLVRQLVPGGPARVRARRRRRARRGQRVLRRGARQRRRRARHLRARPTSPTCCWCASTGSTTTPARSCAPPARAAAGSPTTCSRRRPGCRPRRSTTACAAPSR